MIRRQFKAMVMGALLGTTAIWWSAAGATPMDQSRQLDIGHSVATDVVIVIQKDDVVGFAWSQASGDPCRYSEYWYLSPDYVYPGSAGLGETIVTTLEVFDTATEMHAPADFFAVARSYLPVGKRIVAPVFELENCGAEGFNP